MNRFNIETSAKYSVIATLLGKQEKTVKKYFYYNKKDVNNTSDLKEYFKKEYNKGLKKETDLLFT